MLSMEILICSGSVSASLALRHTARRHLDFLYEILFINSRKVWQGTNVIFMWVQAHSGVLSNEKADKLAKEAVEKELLMSILK